MVVSESRYEGQHELIGQDEPEHQNRRRVHWRHRWVEGRIGNGEVERRHVEGQHQARDDFAQPLCHLLIEARRRSVPVDYAKLEARIVECETGSREQVKGRVEGRVQQAEGQ